MGNDNKVTLEGLCASVNISGNDNEVTGSSRAVRVSGNDNKLTLDQVDSIAVSGNDNGVTYKRTATKKKVRISNLGNGNKIGKVK